MRNFIVSLFLILSIQAVAQKTDSLFVSNKDNGWVLFHKVKTGEDIFKIGRRYHVPPAMLSDANDISYQQQLAPDTKLVIPIGAYNLLTAKPAGNDVRPLYLKISEESLQKIARKTGVSQHSIQQWNNLETTELRKGQVLLIGWLLYDNTDLTVKPGPSGTSKIQVENDGWNNNKQVHTETIIIKVPDTTDKTDTISEGEKLFLAQTSNETIIETEKGTGAFFKRAGKSVNGIYFAFHNTAKRGTILKIYNPGTNKTVYAKVIGKVPVNQTFYNALFGLSSDAKIALGTMSDKVWCEVSYAP